MKKTLLPTPGIADKDLTKLSRQQRYKLRRFAEGLCISCGQMPRCQYSRTLCPKCLKEQRERMRRRIGASRRNLRSKGYDAASVDRRRIEAVRGKLPFRLPKPRAAKRAAAAAAAAAKTRQAGADESLR
jgi:hypothetical protein